MVKICRCNLMRLWRNLQYSNSSLASLLRTPKQGKRESAVVQTKSKIITSNRANKPKYTKTEDITVTKTDPSLFIFGGGNFQMKWAKKWLSNTLTHSHHIFIKMLWPTKEQFSIQFILFCYCYNKVIKLW